MDTNLLRTHCVILGLALSGIGFTQSPVSLGFKGGIQQNDLSLQDATDHTKLLGWHAGAFVRVAPPAGAGIQAELLFTTKGAVASFPEASAGDADIRLNYIELPVMMVFPIGPVDLHAGVYGGHLLSVGSANVQGLDGEFTTLRKDDFQGTDYGLLAGGTVRLGKWQAGGRYVLGLGTIGSDSGPDFLNGARNRQVQVYLGYSLL